MSIISHAFVHYGLLILAIIGLIQCVRVFRVAVLDMRALRAQKVNGGRELVVQTRWHQSAFMLAVFAVFVVIAGRIALADEAELDVPLVQTFVSAMNVAALLLMLKERTILKGRERQDLYYESQMLNHTHRRSTDKASGAK